MAKKKWFVFVLLGITAIVFVFWFSQNKKSDSKAILTLSVPGVDSQTATRSWQEKDGVIYFTVVSDGMTGEQWIQHFGEEDITPRGKKILRSSQFKPTKGVVYQVAVLKGTLFSDSNLVTRNIRAGANHRKLAEPNPELACLIRKNLSNEEIRDMGLWWIVTMHKPVKDSGGGLDLLCVNAFGAYCPLGVVDGRPDGGWSAHDGFAFVVP